MLKAIDPNRCPVDQALEVVGGKWKPLILWRLAGGTLRFGQLQRAVAGVTQRMLTLQLRELERDGLVVRTVHAQVPPKVEYTLTPAAKNLLPVLRAMGEWLLRNHAGMESPPRKAARPAAASDTRAANARVFRMGK